MTPLMFLSSDDGTSRGPGGGRVLPRYGPGPDGFVPVMQCGPDGGDEWPGPEGTTPTDGIALAWRRCRPDPDPEPSPPPQITLPDSRRASRVLPRTRAGSLPHVRVGTGRARPDQSRGTRRAAPSKQNSANGGRRGPSHAGTHPEHRRPLKETPRRLSARPGLQRQLTPSKVPPDRPSPRRRPAGRPASRSVVWSGGCGPAASGVRTPAGDESGGSFLPETSCR